MMRTIHLHGHLKKKFGATHRFDVATAAEALRALNCAFPGDFVTALQAGSYRLVRGDKSTGMRLDIDLVSSLKLGAADLHLIPAAVGASNGKGVGKAILGAVLVGAAIFMAPATAGAGILGGMSAVAPIGMGVTWGNIALVGLGLALSGASTLLAGNTNGARDEKKDETSHTINGPSNIAGEGSAIPLIYGEVITGSVTVSFDANIEDIGAYNGQTGSMGSSVQVVKTSEGFDYYNAVVAG